MAHALTPSQVQLYRDQGYVVVPGLYGETELQPITESLLRAVRRDHGEPQPASRYVLLTNVVEDPALARSASDPRIVDAVETLLGGAAALATFVAYLKTPGAAGTMGDYSGSHPEAHQDYKPYHNAGSSLNWLFAIMSLVDLDEQTGPLFVAPGSHKLSRVIETGGRVRRVRRAGADSMAPLVDTRLRRGDLLLMNMFTWHAGGANRSDHNRLGVYNKYRARNAPPACGPIVFSDAAHRAVVCRGHSLLPHHGEQPVTALRLLVERDGKFLLSRHSRGTDTDLGSWELPGDNSSAAANHLTALEGMARRSLHIDLPWASYLGDFDEAGRRCRVFGYSPPAGDVLATASVAWFTRCQIEDLASQGRLLGGYEAAAVDLWLDPSFLRGIGQSKEQALRDNTGVP